MTKNKFSARAWSHSTGDHFHDEWGFITADKGGKVTLITAGNNGLLFVYILFLLNLNFR